MKCLFLPLPRCDWTGMYMYRYFVTDKLSCSYQTLTRRRDYSRFSKLSTLPVRLRVSSGRISYATWWGGYFIRKNYNLCVITYMYVHVLVHMYCTVHISKRKAKEKAGNTFMIGGYFGGGAAHRALRA